MNDSSNSASDQPTLHQDHPLANQAEIDMQLSQARTGPMGQAAGSPLLPLMRVGEYELISEIRRGGMGVVFNPLQIRLNRVVALKMILGGVLAKPFFLQPFDTE